MATKEWCNANRDKMRYSSDKSASKRFIRKATNEDLKTLHVQTHQEIETRAKETRDKE